MSEKYKIKLIICYMGKLPWYFKYFALSCGYNPSIDFSVITDDSSIDFDLPVNVTVHNSTLKEIGEIASLKLDLKIQITHGYKLCDFKPAYGLIFEDLIVGYDFWGYGDLDIIFGNIKTFITDDLLKDYEVISVRHDFLTGYFQLFKNNEFTVNLFKHSKDYIKVFTSDKHYCFDETNFTHEEFTNDIPIKFIKCEIDSMMHVVRRLEDEGKLKAFFDFFVIEGLSGNLEWDNGS